jgi:predicted O-methyltransferase YrrM
MKKINKLIRGILLLIKKPYLINQLLNSDEVLKSIFSKEFPEANETAQISLQSIHHSTNKHQINTYSFLSGSSLITDFIVLKLACLRLEAKDYLEIGTWRGESVANVADIVENCYTLNLSDEALKKLNLEKEYIDLHRFFSKSKPNVCHLFGDSRTFNFDSLNKKFDVIFIDGDHHTEAVEADTNRLFPCLKNEKSILVWHDAKSDTEKIRYEVLLGIYRGMPKETHPFIYLVENSLCAIYIPEILESKPLNIYGVPSSNFELTISMKPIEIELPEGKTALH